MPGAESPVVISRWWQAVYRDIRSEQSQIFPVPPGEPPRPVNHDLVLVKALALDDLAPLVPAEGVVAPLILHHDRVPHLQCGQGPRVLGPLLLRLHAPLPQGLLPGICQVHPELSHQN